MPRLDAFDEVRADFPHLQQRTYLDTATAGLAPRGVGGAAAAFYDSAMSRGWAGQEEWRAKGEGVRRRVADLLAVDPAEVDFTASTTDGINHVLHSLPWRPGDRVVVAEDEFPSVRLAVEETARSGAQVVHVRPDSEEGREDALLAALDARTRVLAITHVHWKTGTRLDLRRLGTACRRSGTLLVVDGIQALGAVPVDLAEVDVYVSAVFKWLLSGFGTAIVVVRERAAAQLQPAFRGYSNPPPSQQLRASHWNYPGLYVLDAGLAYLDALGWDRIHDRVARLSLRVADGATSLGLAVSPHASRLAGIVSIEVPDAVVAVRALAERGIDVAERGGALRVSPHLYNSEGDVDRLFEAGDALLSTAGRKWHA